MEKILFIVSGTFCNIGYGFLVVGAQEELSLQTK